MCLILLEGYRMFLSPFVGRSCRFEPTCSRYASDAIARYGAFRGLGLAMLRLLKCHPFHSGGDDPVR